MLRIPCPYCGVRDQVEFTFGGESQVIRPNNPHESTDAEWANYLFYRQNIKGIHQERWVHSFGCRQWFNLARDTVSHEIIEAYRMGDQSTLSEDQTDHG